MYREINRDICMVLELGKIRQIGAVNPRMKVSRAVDPQPALNVDKGFQARLGELDKRERPPVVPNRVICTA